MLNKEKPVKTVIDKQKCIKCALCTKVCADYLKLGEDGYPQPQSIEKVKLGCIQCGHCMMVCPTSAIEIIGQDIDKNHLKEITYPVVSFEELNNLFLKRRSIRKFKNKEIEKDTIAKIINAAATAAVGLPPSEVKVLVINGREKVKEFTSDVIEELRKAQKFLNPFTVLMAKPFMSKANYKVFSEFIVPLMKHTIEESEMGNDILFYDAPALMLFYGDELSDKVDWVIAGTQATLAAAALELGTCWVGTISEIFSGSKKLCKKYRIKKTDRVGAGFILGYPDIKFNKAFQRNFKQVTFVE